MPPKDMLVKLLYRSSCR